MAKFIYEAKNINAKRTKGTLDAVSEIDAIAHLRQNELFVIWLKEDAQKKGGKPLSPKYLAEFCKELSAMLIAGIPIARALGVIMGDKSVNPKLKPVYSELHVQIIKGMSLSEAMREQGSVFPELIINMFYSGEVSSSLGIVAKKMADYYESDYRLKNKIKSATTYPKILGGITVAAMVMVFTFVLPNFLQLFKDTELPAITKVVLGISSFVTGKWYYIIAGAVLLVMALSYLSKVPILKFYADGIILKIPKIGELLRVIYTARFSITLSYMYGAGIQIVKAVEVAGKTIGNDYIENKFLEIVKKMVMYKICEK